MSNRIEEIIDDIEEYIDTCKYQPLSNSKIIVNKEEIDELIAELRMRVPDEIKKYQKIVNQQDAILKDAQLQAQNMINDAQSQIDVLISDHEVMQRAYQKANEVVEEARGQAEGILNDAYADASAIREGAIQYTDSLLQEIQGIISTHASESRTRLDQMFSSLESIYNECSENRSKLGVTGAATDTDETERTDA